MTTKIPNLHTILIAIFLTAFSLALPTAAQAKRTKANQAASLPEDRQYTVGELADMAATYRQTGNTLALIYVLRNWAVLEPKRFDVRLELGGLYIAQNRFPDAIRTLNEAMALIPSDEAPHRLLAGIYGRQGNDSLHGFHLARAAFLAQRNWENQYNLAVYHISKGRISQAERLLEKTMELNAAFAPAKFEYGKLMIGKGDYEAAFMRLREASAIEQGNMGYRAYLAYSAALSGRNTIAQEELEIALMDDPKNPIVQYAAGLTRFHYGDNKAAEQALRAALRHSPADILALEALGDVLAADFKYGDAVATYMQVWQRAGYSERIAHKLGKTLAYDGKPVEAKDFLEAVVFRNPQNGDAVLRLAEVYCELKDVKRAKEVHERLGGGKNPAWFQAVQGRIQELTGQHDPALISYRAARIINPQNPHVIAGFGRMARRQGSYDSALVYFETAAALEPANIRNFIDKAKTLEAKGNKGEALKVYESVIARSPRRPEMYLAAAAIMEEQSDLKGAIRLLDRGVRANPGESAMLFALGRLFEMTGQHHMAIETYAASIGRRANENNRETLRIIGDIYYSKLSDEKKAREFFRKYQRAGGKDSRVDELMRNELR